MSLALVDRVAGVVGMERRRTWEVSRYMEESHLDDCEALTTLWG